MTKRKRLAPLPTTILNGKTTNGTPTRFKRNGNGNGKGNGKDNPNFQPRMVEVKLGRPLGVDPFDEKTEKALRMMARLGATDKDMAEGVGVSEHTLNNWKKKYPKFFLSISEWKSMPNDLVKRSLYERAIGYTCKETKLFNHYGTIISVEVDKEYPPDTAAAHIFLKNRDRANWKDKWPEDDVDSPTYKLAQFLQKLTESQLERVLQSVIMIAKEDGSFIKQLATGEKE